MSFGVSLRAWRNNFPLRGWGFPAPVFLYLWGCVYGDGSAFLAVSGFVPFVDSLCVVFFVPDALCAGRGR